MKNSLSCLALACLLAAGPAASAKAPEPAGLIAVSAGNTVELVVPLSGTVKRFDSGPVGWLYPGPGGVLFAPDLVHGKTLVIDLRKLRVIRKLDGVTMPHFGPKVADRYVSVAGDVLVLSYPDRAVISRVQAQITRPWQVLISRDWASLLILERTPGIAEPPILWTVDLPGREVIRKTRLDAHVTSMAFSQSLGLLALADGPSGVRLVDPATLNTVRLIATGGTVTDVAFSGDGKLLLAAVAADHHGTIDTFELKIKHESLRASRRKPVNLDASPVRLTVSPTGEWAAAGTDAPGLVLFRVGHPKTVHHIPLSATPRDVEWCDVSRRGPLLPEWSR